MPITVDPNALYSDEEAAPILRKNPRTQAKDRCLGRGPTYVKAGKTILYKGSDLLDFLNERRVAHGTEYRERFGRAVGRITTTT